MYPKVGLAAGTALLSVCYPEDFTILDRVTLGCRNRPQNPEIWKVLCPQCSMSELAI